VRAARALRWARLTAGLSQRQLADRSGVPQSTVGRIEAGSIDPRVGTLSRLLRACGFDLEVTERIGQGIDRTLMHPTPPEGAEDRLRRIGVEGRNVARLRTAVRVRS
jgi:transcriptional regulator with XRE-family HTH domain